MAIKSLSIRIDEAMLDKLHIVADYEGRSANSQILILIRDCIEDYEQRHGKIQPEKWTISHLTAVEKGDILSLISKRRWGEVALSIAAGGNARRSPALRALSVEWSKFRWNHG